MDSSELDVGYVAGAHGIRGGLRIKLYDPESHALASGTPVSLTRDGERVGRFTVDSAEPVPGKLGLFRTQLEGVGTRHAADALKGCALIVTRDALPELGDDEFYLADTIGLEVVREAEPSALGTVVGLTSNGVQDLLEVQWVDPAGTKHRWLLPVLPHVVRDVDATRVVVELSEGFLPEALELPS